MGDWAVDSCDFSALPDNDLLMFILVLSSRFHLTLGVGDPVALQVNVSLDPSRTITSLLLIESSIFGGTRINKNYVSKRRNNLLILKINSWIRKYILILYEAIDTLIWCTKGNK